MADPEDQLVLQHLYEPLAIHGGLGKQEVQGATSPCPGEAVPRYKACGMFNFYYNVTLSHFLTILTIRSGFLASAAVREHELFFGKHTGYFEQTCH